MGLIEIAKNSFRNWNNFKGSISRKDFWLSILVNILCWTVVGIFFIGIADNPDTFVNTLLILVAVTLIIYLYINFFSLCARRLHDVNKSGWWSLLPLLATFFSNSAKQGNSKDLFYLISVFLSAYFIYLLCQPGSINNKFSKDIMPKKNPKIFEFFTNIARIPKFTFLILPIVSIVGAIIFIDKTMSADLVNQNLLRCGGVSILVFGTAYQFIKESELHKQFRISLISSAIFLLFSYISINPDIHISQQTKSLFQKADQIIKSAENDSNAGNIDTETDYQMPNKNLNNQEKFSEVLKLMDVCLKKNNLVTNNFDNAAAKLPISTILLPQSLSSTDNVNRAGRILADYIRAFEEYTNALIANRNEYRAGAELIYGSETKLMKDFDSTFQANSSLLRNYKDRYMETFDVYAEIILLMINVTKNNQVTLQDGNLYFNNELDLTKYNSLIAKANEAEIKSKVALTEYNSAFEKFKKAIEDASK
jgi:uncharacterized membrane protein YhaH (DUF805 family)